MTEGAKRYAQGVPTISGEFAENGTIFRSLLPTPSDPATPGHLKVNCPEGAREATLGCVASLLAMTVVVGTRFFFFIHQSSGHGGMPYLTAPENCAKMSGYMPLWWNGRHRGLKIRWGQLRTGSSPVSGTRKKHLRKQVLFSMKFAFAGK